MSSTLYSLDQIPENFRLRSSACATREQLAEQREVQTGDYGEDDIMFWKAFVSRHGLVV